MLLILAVSESVSGEPPRLSSDAGKGPLGNGACLQDLYGSLLKSLRCSFSGAFVHMAPVPGCWEKYKEKTTLRSGFSSFLTAHCW